jgi:hypothetical protein
VKGNPATGGRVMSKTTKTPAKPTTKDSGRVHVGGGMMRF